jgi:hypothetical protein
MLPLRIVESDREGFDEPVVEIWRDDDFVGMVFWDDELAVLQVYPDADGDVYDLELGDLFRVLGLAEAIVTPEEFRPDESEYGGIEFAVESPAGGDDDWESEHPAAVALVTEFDPLASHRSADGEGFFPRQVAFDFIARCNELDLAVVEMEAFDFDGLVLKPRPQLVLAVSLPGADQWHVFRPAANALVQDTLSDWPSRSSLVVAFVVQQPDGETFVA